VGAARVNPSLADDLDLLAERTGFSGAVRVDRPDREPLVRAYGLACRRHLVATTPDTRFGTASGTKGFTAVTVLRLVEQGTLALDDRVRPILGDDLPLIDDRVTIEHLLAHTSGIGDYLEEDEADEGDPDAFLLPVPVHELATTEAYLRVLDGFPMRAQPGSRFAYCNGGYVVLALVAERAAGVPFHDLVRDLVCHPAGLRATAFDRGDQLPPEVATGYLGVDDDRTNVLHLPVRGSGDGGLVTTVGDVHRFWRAFADGRIVDAATVASATRVRNLTTSGTRGYGLGFWLAPDGTSWELVGADAGVSFRSLHRPADGLTWTVVSNTTDAAWPIAALVDGRADDSATG
jgi:CubicO group peptidase (beta-lactamase class C family)